MFKKFIEEQKIPCKIIENIINNKHYAHAYIIETNGYDKSYDFAKNFAKLILCPNHKNGQTDCDECNICRMIDNDNFPELRIINPETYWIKKEQLIDLQEEFNKKSILGNKKIYIINKAERLNNNSANTILKFLEEPSEGIIAILLTKNRFQLIDTIISRCQIISLNGKSNIKEKERTIEKIGLLLNDNESDYENFISEQNEEKINNIIRFINYYEKYKLKTLIYINEYWFNYFNDKDNIDKAFLIMIYFYKDVLNYKMNRNLEIFKDCEEIINISHLNTIDDIIKKITIINKNKRFIENNG